jgi:hypothetical protein
MYLVGVKVGFHSTVRRCALHGGTQSSRAFARVSPAPTLRGGQTQQHSIHAHEWISLWHSQQRKRNTQAPSTAEGLIGDPSETRSWKAIDSGDVRGNAYCVMRSTHQSKLDKLRPALPASAGGWKAFIDAEELIKNISTNRLVSTRPVPT